MHVPPRRAAAIIAALAPEDAALVEAAFAAIGSPLPASATRNGRMARRNAIVRAVMASIQGPNVAHRACTLERLLRKAESPSPGVEVDAGAREILALSDGGRAIGWARIRAIAQGGDGEAS